MTNDRIVAAGIGAVAGVVVVAASVRGSPLLVALVPAALLLRFVWSPSEEVMTAAIVGIAVLTVMNLHDGSISALTAAGGGFVAVELASLAAAVRRSESIHGLGFRVVGVAQAVAIGVGGLIAVALVALL